ncbi:MAG: hypothetical protein IT361_15395 [Gemmatimonadaceae bacterium]|nr:hypothetical protein [Gemmatimonadaceae bacterium]
MTKLRASVVLLLALSSACSHQSPEPTATAEYSLLQAGDSVPLPLGREVQVGEVLMVLSDVPSESRCPANAICVWAGDAVAAITVHPPCFRQGCKAPSTNLALHTHLEPRAGQAWGHTVRLVALTPYPIDGQPREKSRYTAWVRVTR